MYYSSNPMPLQEMSCLKISHTDPEIYSAIIHRLLFHFSRARAGAHIVVVCIGTDRSTGDALGPLVGTALARFHSPLFSLYGTLDNPVHAVNLEETLNLIRERHDKPYIIGIDACLGHSTSVGSIQVVEGPLRPGAGVNKQLPPVGDIHLTGIVNVGGFMEYFVLQNTRLSLVMKLSEIIASSLFSAMKQWHVHAKSAAAQE
ncbi:putative sporulation protein YyaC [Paenibacillus sophorae]|uniref:Putative sporulation protein YyaC n=1 Tax=Paenibacillus sophorae TaxID=1333845 RepID=A0A1H8TN17_9BACL|nr:spore protease YyaC [Paenibacillus sophorae]QWU16289.1 spore protease YyaC [Paenibacillus sophorae]SEO92004.1 putative sporulation protein YyaC [Paenibacillus sophorae]